MHNFKFAPPENKWSRACTRFSRNVRLPHGQISTFTAHRDFFWFLRFINTLTYLLTEKLIHWPLMPAQSPPGCTKCNSPPINGQCTNHCIAVECSVALRFWIETFRMTGSGIGIILLNLPCNGAGAGLGLLCLTSLVYGVLSTLMS